MTAIGFALRCHCLRQRGMWWDEAAVWSEALTGRRNPDEAPLNTWLTRLTMVLMRRNDALALHVPALLFGSFTILAAFRLGRAAAGAACGLATALLVTVSPALLLFSQEARPYALLILVTTLQLAVGLELVAAWSLPRLGWLLGLSCAAVASHLVALPFSLGLGLALVLALGWRSVREPAEREPAEREPAERTRWLKRIGLVVGAGVLALAAGAAWTLFRPSFKPVMAGRYLFGAVHLLRYALVRATTFSFNLEPSPIPWEARDTIAAIYVAAAVTGAVAIAWRRQCNRVLLLVLPALALLSALYLELGDKSVWGWMRYATPIIVPLFALAAAGGTAWRRAWISVPLVGALAALNAPRDTGLPMWARDARVMRGWEYAAAAKGIQRLEGALQGIIFIEQSSIYADETDRMSASYALYRNDKLPLFHARPPHGIFRVELRPGPGKIPVPFLTDDGPLTLPDGDYAVFDGWVKMGCARYSDHLVASPLAPTPGSIFIVCRWN